MIKANELRIGNYILIDKKVIKIEGIHEQGINPYVGMGDADVQYDFEFCLIEGIQLTPEILEKAGFKKKTGITWFTSKNNTKVNLVQYHGTGKITFPFNENGLITIHSLHQLQNLFYCLCGTELQINLYVAATT